MPVLFKSLLDKTQHLGASTIATFRRLGRASVFLLEVLASSASVLARPSLLIKQLYSVGVQTLIIIVVAGLFVGMVMET